MQSEHNLGQYTLKEWFKYLGIQFHNSQHSKKWKALTTQEEVGKNGRCLKSYFSSKLKWQLDESLQPQIMHFD